MKEMCALKRLVVPTVALIMTMLVLSQSAVLAKGKAKESISINMVAAIENGDLAKVKAAVLKKPQLVNQAMEDGYMPLACAAGNGKTEIVKFLLTKGAKVNAVTEINDHGDKYTVSAMHMAVWKRDRNLISLLLNYKANINISGKYSPAPLACYLRDGYIYNPDSDFVEFLLAHSANVESSDKLGGTPVIYAAATGDVALVRMLLKHGANLSHRTNNGLNALHTVADPIPTNVNEATKIEIAKVLLSGGADPNETTTCAYNKYYPNLHKVVTIPAGTTPRGLAEIGGFNDLADFLSQNGGQ